MGKTDSADLESSEQDIEEQGMMSSHKISSTLASGVDLDTRTLYLMGDIDEKAAYIFLVGLKHLSATPGDITLVISSPGGIEHYGYAIYDALRHTPNTVIAEGYGIVASMASAIFQGADIRYISENCEYLIHNGSLEVGTGSIEQDQIQQLADQILVNSKRYYQILYDNSNCNMEEVKKYCDEEKTFSAAEAVSVGFADFILKPNKSKIRKKKTKKGKK